MAEAAVSARYFGRGGVTTAAGIVAVGSMWGVAFLFTAVSLRQFSFMQVASGRLAIAAFVLAVFATFTKSWSSLASVPVRLLLAMGILNAALPVTLVTLAQRQVPSSTAALFNATVPVLTVALALVSGAERRPGAARLIGTGVGFIGVVVMVGVAGDGSWGARAALFGAALSYASSFVLAGRSRLSAASGVATAAVQMMIGAAVVGVVMLVRGWSPVGAPGAPVIALFTLAVVSTALPAGLFYWLVREAGPGRASLTTYMVPVVGVMAGWAVLQETPSPQAAVGAAIVLAGVVVGQRRGRPAKNQAEEVR
ncbi:DMT family transporter [Dactylosporangium sp. CA-233914]|uniref:DMT family transporter n=1 Tax=Dactylosporangium sp. CA-233914 TaxID=3239934 RepID=UPI003D8C91DA